MMTTFTISLPKPLLAMTKPMMVNLPMVRALGAESLEILNYQFKYFVSLSYNWSCHPFGNEEKKVVIILHHVELKDFSEMHLIIIY